MQTHQILLVVGQKPMIDIGEDNYDKWIYVDFFKIPTSGFLIPEIQEKMNFDVKQQDACLTNNFKHSVCLGK